MSEQRHVERMNVVLNRDREGDQRLLAALEALPEGQRMHMCRYLLLKHMPGVLQRHPEKRGDQG